jgi:hypothetical protein
VFVLFSIIWISRINYLVHFVVFASSVKPPGRAGVGTEFCRSC